MAGAIAWLLSRRVQGAITIAAANRRIGFGPNVESAAFAGVFGACRAGLSLGLILGSIDPRDLKAFSEQSLARFLKPAAGVDVVGHLLTDPFAARLPVVRGHQANAVHPLGPLFVVVAGAACLAKMVLLQMHHFVHERREHVGCTARREVLRIERNFIGQAFAAAVPTIAAKVTVGAAVSMIGNQARRQPGGE